MLISENHLFFQYFCLAKKNVQLLNTIGGKCQAEMSPRTRHWHAVPLAGRMELENQVSYGIFWYIF